MSRPAELLLLLKMATEPVNISLLHNIIFMFSKSLTLCMSDHINVAMIHLHVFFVCSFWFVTRENFVFFSSMYDNPLTPSTRVQFENNSSQIILCVKYLRCNFFTPFTRALSLSISHPFTPTI